MKPYFQESKYLRKVNILNKSALIFELGRKVGNMGPQEVSKSTQISILQPPTRKSEINLFIA